MAGISKREASVLEKLVHEMAETRWELHEVWKDSRLEDKRGPVIVAGNFFLSACILSGGVGGLLRVLIFGE